MCMFLCVFASVSVCLCAHECGCVYIYVCVCVCVQFIFFQSVLKVSLILFKKMIITSIAEQ